MQRFDTLTQPASTRAGSRQYLTFLVGPEEYGVDILKVQEVKGYAASTPVPNVPSYVKGVMNLRGTIIPVIDARVKFGLEPVEYTRANVIVVLSVGPKVMGLVADAVSDVVSFAAAEVQPPPEFGDPGSRWVEGLARAGDKVVLLLDIDRMLAAESAADLPAVV